MSNLKSRVARMLKPMLILGDARGEFSQLYGKRYAKVYNHRLVEGFLSDREAIRLFDIASNLQRNDAVVVEIGSWLGKSSTVLSLGLENKPAAKLFCIDPFNADGDARSAAAYAGHMRQLNGTLLEVFRHNIEKYGNPAPVHVLQGYSIEYSISWNTPIDLLFIDANHDFESVTQDLLEWGKFIRIGGYLALHDVRLDSATLIASGPAQAVAKNVLHSDYWGEKTLTDSLFTAKRVKASDT